VPSRRASSAGHREEGTASVELVAAIPFLLLAAFVAAQIGLVGQALWSAGIAARAGARAAEVSGDPRPAARRALPPRLRAGARIVAGDDGVAVVVEAPRLSPALPRLDVGARSALGGG
jgi:Flp pilus assembly protein TadG